MCWLSGHFCSSQNYFFCLKKNNQSLATPPPTPRRASDQVIEWVRTGGKISFLRKTGTLSQLWDTKKIKQICTSRGGTWRLKFHSRDTFNVCKKFLPCLLALFAPKEAKYQFNANPPTHQFFTNPQTNLNKTTNNLAERSTHPPTHPELSEISSGPACG